MYTLGVIYIIDLIFAVMINTGTFGTLVDRVAAQAPGQVETLTALADQLAGLTIADIGMGFLERVFGVLFHIGGIDPRLLCLQE